MPRVVFALRSDALIKPGGDSTKVRRYQEALAKHGWDSTVVVDPAELETVSADIVHLMNLDLPLENLRYAGIAARRSKPIALSTIRHPFEGVQAMYENGEDSFYAYTRKLGVSADRAVSLREAIKLARSGRIRSSFGVGSFRSNQQRLVDRMTALLPMASGEAAAIDDLFEPSGDTTIIRNGFSFTTGEIIHQEPVYDIVSVGRIEPRKNSLALATAAVELGATVLFIGAVNERHRKYASKFRQLVHTHPGLSHLGPIEHDRLPALLRSARTYVNPAWFEVVSQADVEAASVGLPIVTTKNGYIQDALGESTPTLDPLELASNPADTLAAALDSATARPSPTPRPWSECGAELAEVYARMLRR